MDDRARIAHQRLIESSQRICRSAQELVDRARDATKRGAADLERMREVLALHRVRVAFYE